MADIFAMVDTWNNGATTFTAVKMNVTDTASAAGSLLMDLQVGGVSKFKIAKNGDVTAREGVFGGGGGLYFQNTARTVNILEIIGSTLSIGSNINIGWSATTEASDAKDLSLFRDAANILAQRNGTAAQAFRTYTSFTDGANYERFGVNTAAGVTTLAAESAGTGSANIDLALNPLGTGRIKVANGMTANGTVATAMSSVGPTGSSTTVQEWLAIKNAAGTVRYIPCF